jgi:PAS domain S-box-containing protein
MKESARSLPLEYFSRLYNGITDAVFLAEYLPDGTPGSYVEVNDVACELLQYSRVELLQKSPYVINRLALQEPDVFATILADIENRGKTLFKTELLRADGTWVAVEIGSQRFELDGRPVYFSVARDITVREEYEASIRTLVRSTVGLTGEECLVEITRNLCAWLHVDEAAIALFGPEDNVSIKTSSSNLFTVGDQFPLSATPFAEIQRHQFVIYPDAAESHFPREDFFGGSRPLSAFIGCPMLNHRGEVMGAIFALSSQRLQSVPHVEELLSVIAARAAAECERLQYERDLADNEEMLRTLFNSTAEAIVGIDLQGRVIFCNPTTLDMLGHACNDDLQGRPFWQLIDIEGADQHADNRVCPFVRALQQGQRICRQDSIFRGAEGEQIAVEYWVHPMRRDEQLVGGVITFIDITQRKTLETQLQHSQRMEAIGTLTGGIAHDFNNILTVISGYVGLLQSHFAEDPKVLKKIQKIGEAAERGSRLTHGLLAYSRKKSVPSMPVDLNQLVLNVQDIFGRMIGEEIRKNLTLSQQQLVVLADSSQLEQVLVNLATNARDAMPGGGILTMKTEQAEIDAEFCRSHGYGEPGNYALITVTDTGVGIPAEIQQKVFDPFYTTKETGKGTGLGLAMVWGIVKQHKGYILLHSAPGEGSQFKIYLPLSQQPLPEILHQPTGKLPGGKETILLVEDDPLVRESTHSILSAVGYQVLTSDRAEPALKILQENLSSLSLVLSDVVMPGLKGFEFYREIRKIAGLPVIFMSGYTFDSLYEQGLVKEGVLLLNKPIQPKDLLFHVRQTLDNSQQQNE